MTRGIPTPSNDHIPIFIETFEWLYGMVILRCRQGISVWDVRVSVPTMHDYAFNNDDWIDD